MTGAVELARLIAAGEVTASEVLERHLDRIATRNPDINAVVVVDEAGARQAAAVVDRAVRAGVDLPPLAGVPTTIKEAFAVRGLPTTAGMLDQSRRPAQADAPAVSRLRKAGAIIIGKTNVPTQLADLHCANALYGVTANPWDRSRTSGGSSGGSAAALAADLSALELGSDLSGSIRIPSSWCGVVGLRPSNGRISKRGHLPWPLDGLLEPSTSVVGPMGRSVADVAAALAALVGGSAEVRPPPVTDLRIGWWAAATGAPVDAETTASLTAAVKGLRDAGASVEPLVAPIDPEVALTLAWRLVDAEISHGLTSEQWAAAQEPGVWPTAAVSLHDHLRDQEARLRLTAAWDPVWERVDAVLCPAAAVTAQPLDDHRSFADRPLLIDGAAHPGRDLSAWSLLTSVGHLPSVTLPVGLGDATGLPIGAQLVGAPRADHRLLSVAATVEAVLAPLPLPALVREEGRDEVVARR